MSEFSSVYYQNGFQPNAGQLNTPQRKAMGELAIALMLMHERGGSSATGVVVGSDSLIVSGLAGDMRVQIGAGTAVLYDSTISPPAFPVQMIQQYSSSPVYSALLSDGPGGAGESRIDVICCRSVSSLLDTELVAKKGSPAEMQPTRRGGAFEVLVVEGVAAVGPVAPATPSWYMKLCEVEVPKDVTAINPPPGGTTQCIITDFRNFRSMDQRGPFDSATEELLRYIETWAGGFNMMQLGGHPASDEPLKKLMWRGDMDEHWPCFRRDDVPTDDSTLDLYPMLIPGSRVWRKIMPGEQGQIYDRNSANYNWETLGVEHIGDDYKGLQVYSTVAGSQITYISYSPEVHLRNVSITEAKIFYHVNTAWAGGAMEVELFHWKRSTNTTTPISGAVAMDNTLGPKETSVGAVSETTIYEGDILSLRVKITLAAAAVGNVDFRSAQFSFKEGRKL